MFNFASTSNPIFNQWSAMKTTIITLAFLAFVSVAHAADSNSGRSQSKVAGKSASIAYATTPFDISAERLPAKYQGHSILEIHKKRTPPRPKGQFEKSKEYDDRVAKWKGVPFLGKITPGDILAFEIPDFLAPSSLVMEYDADSEKLKATVSFWNRWIGAEKSTWLQTFYKSKALGSYIGVTRMGVRFRVESNSSVSVGLGVKEYLREMSIVKSVPRDEALRAKGVIRAYAIASLADPYIIDYSDSSTASLDSPNEWKNKYFGLWVNLRAIWLVNWLTGEVVAKSEFPFTECRYSAC